MISSGDNESHSHPRPDALGAFGKHGRGERPFIFSTELARSTAEFTTVANSIDTIREYIRQFDAAQSDKQRKAITREMEEQKDRNVVVYGMITMRAPGDKVIIAQKLEVPRNEGAKWDTYKLHYHGNKKMFEYLGH